MFQVQVSQKADQGFQTTALVNGHTTLFDVVDALGGQDAGPSPHEMLLASLGACTAMTVRMYAQRKGWPLDEVTVSVEQAEESKNSPIVKTLTLTGELSDEQRERLYAISEKCPVNQLLQQPIIVKSQMG